MSSNPLYGPIYDNYGCGWIFGRRTVGRAMTATAGFPGRRSSASKLTAADKARLQSVVNHARKPCSRC
ncbi:hypothetical protein BTE77_34860 [Ensifer adhaerens]|nr:hypothetical protein BTE77_34860 [Ensifer adhaerens]